MTEEMMPKRRQRSRSRSASPARQVRTSRRGRPSSSTLVPHQPEGVTCEDHSMPLALAGRAVVFSVLAWPTLTILNGSDAVKDHTSMFATGIIVLVGFLWLAKQFFGAAVRKEVFVGFFMVSTFTCAIDIFLATEIHGDGKGIMGWYLERGERYFQSAYGFAINAWDGSSHYMMYIAMIYALSSHRPEAFRPLYFTWLGSIFYSLIIFLPGAVVGPYSNELCLSTLLNVPYILVPVIFFFKLQAQYRPAVKALHSAHTFSARLLVDTAFIFLLVAAAVIAFLRFAVSLDSKLPLADMWARYEPTLHDENKFFHIYGIVSMYYFIPLYCAFAYLLAFGTTVGSTAQFVTELAWVHAGGSLQAQFAYTVSAFHWRTSSQRQVAEDSQSLFLLMNGLLFIVPAMFATYVHCCGFPSQPLWHF